MIRTRYIQLIQPSPPIPIISRQTHPIPIKQSHDHPKTSPTLNPLLLTATSAPKSPTTSTTNTTIPPIINRGLKMRYSIRCLLRCPAQHIVQSATNEKYSTNHAMVLATLPIRSAPFCRGTCFHRTTRGTERAARIWGPKVLAATRTGLQG